MKNSAKYLEQYAAIEEAAKTEIIEILSNNPTGRSVRKLFEEDLVMKW